MASDIKLLDGDEVLVEGAYLTARLIQAAGEEPGSTSINLQNSTGFWHISGPRTYDPGNPLSIFWNNNTNYSGPYLTINTAGSVGIGTPIPGYKLDVADRMRVRQAKDTAGIWFYQTKPAKDQAFVGMSTDTKVGFWGNTGAGWGLVMDTTTGNVDIKGNLDIDGSVKIKGSRFEFLGQLVKTTFPGTGQIPGGTVSFPATIMFAGELKAGDIRVGIGTSKPEKTLDVSGDARITGTITATTVTQTSSRALKENIAEISAQEAVSALANLNPIKFNFKSDDAKKLHVGFIAEDVPELVAMADRETLSSMDIVAVLTKVVQEQQQQISQLVTEVNALKQAQATV